jgi:hypothetical protein
MTSLSPLSCTNPCTGTGHQFVVILYNKAVQFQTSKGSRYTWGHELRGFSPQANYTDQATAACRRS